MKSAENPYKYRIRVCFILFAIAFSILFLRAFFLQVLPDPKLRKVRETQETGTLSVSSPRGTIYDRSGRALAVSVEVASVYADPSAAKWTKKEMEQVSKLLKIPTTVLKQKISNRDRKFVWIKRKIDQNVAKAVKDSGVDGLYVVSEWDRFYPDRESASQTIGVVGQDGNGLEGVEKHYNDFLFSMPTILKMRRDAKGRIIDVDSELYQQGKEGVDVYLTIDSAIQYILDRELITNALKHKVRQAMGLVIDPQSGEILAMSSFPQANPNHIEGRQDVIAMRNLNVVDVFEPGSILKVFVMAGAVEKNLVKSTEIFDCRKNSLRIGNKQIVNPVDKDWLSPRDILKYSNNVGIARIGMRMGRDSIIDTLGKFGFGSKTGIDFPGEGPGMFDTSGKWHDMRLANVSFGQGIAVTGIQLVEALSVIANGGFRVQPHLVKKIDLGADGEMSFHSEEQYRRQVFSTKTVQTVQKWMESVTEKDGTGFRAKLSGYRTAGKTGTAQIFNQDTKEYSHDELIASFFGFAPVSQPRLATLIVYRQPTGSRYGGEIAAPVFRNVMQQALQYLDVPKDDKDDDTQKQFVISKNSKNQNVEKGVVPDFLGRTAREALDISKELSIDVEIVGSGQVYKQVPEKGTKIENQKVQLFLRAA